MSTIVADFTTLATTDAPALLATVRTFTRALTDIQFDFDSLSAEDKELLKTVDKTALLELIKMLRVTNNTLNEAIKNSR